MERAVRQWTLAIRLSVAITATGIAGRAVPAQQPAIRPIGAIVATFSDSIARGSPIRALRDGRVLLIDANSRRLVLLDADLTHPVVVADTTTATSRAYGDGFIGLIPFTNDSTVTMDRLTGAIVVISPDGKIARVIPAPANANRGGVGAFQDGAFQTGAVFDQAGHFLSRAPQPFYLALLPADFVGDTLMRGPDSLAILRENVVTRNIDTLVMLEAPRNRQAVSRPMIGRGSGRPALNPIPSGDDWAVLDDGTVAVIRVADFHVDWVKPDKHIISGPKIPWEWIALTAERKSAIIDSARANMRRTGVVQQAIVAPSDLPDFIPPFTIGFAKADAAGNVWVRENRIGTIYDVINRDGKLAERVQISGGWTLAGFGPGAAYLTRGTGRTVQLAKAALR